MTYEAAVADALADVVAFVGASWPVVVAITLAFLGFRLFGIIVGRVL